MNPPTLDTLCGTIVYLDENHYCKDCKGIFQDDEVHLCSGHPQEPPKLSIGESIKEEVLINGVLE
jgi:hypothetical protein